MNQQVDPSSEVPSSLLWRSLLGMPAISVPLFVFGTHWFRQESDHVEIFWFCVVIAILTGVTLGLTVAPKATKSGPVGLTILLGSGAALTLVAVVPEEIGLPVFAVLMCLFVAYIVSANAKELWGRRHPAVETDGSSPAS